MSSPSNLPFVSSTAHPEHLSIRSNSTTTELKSYRLPFQTPVIRHPALPATYFDYESRSLRIVDAESNDNSVSAFMRQDLNIDQLGDIVQYSGYRGKEEGFSPSTSLYRLQYFFDRGTEKRIIVTEITALHLVYQKNHIFIKPLPAYLLSLVYWDRIRQTNDEKLWINALGFLRSYAQLVRTEMDFNVGMDASQFDRLMPATIDDEGSSLTFKIWRRLVKEILSAYPEPVPPCLENTRWAYSTFALGELDINVRVALFTCHQSALDNSIRPWFRHLYLNGTSFRGVYMQIALFIFAYLALVLSAMQVGLDVNELKESKVFVRLCYGFTIFAMVSPLMIVLHSASFLVLAIGTYLRVPRGWRERSSQQMERRAQWKREHPRKSIFDSWYA